MSDPLSQIVGLLQPNTSFSKLVIASGDWAVRRSDDGVPFYCAVLDGTCLLSIVGREPISLCRSDFVLVPAAYEFVTSSMSADLTDITTDIVEMNPGVFRLGNPTDPLNVRMLVGHCAFSSVNADLIISLLPHLVHVRGDKRLMTLVGLLNDETRAARPGRDVVLARLLEVMLIEALRSSAEPTSPPGLLRGLCDDRLAIALRKMHERPEKSWTVVDLAKKAALSRSTFFGRFRHEIGLAPMEYLLGWRMALAKDLLRRGGTSVAEVAERVGYSSASTFSVAFSRYVGTPPSLYARISYVSEDEVQSNAD